MAKYRRYHTLHRRKKHRAIGKSQCLDDKNLLKKARVLFRRMVKRSAIKQEAKRLPDTTIRIDLMPPPELSFVISIKRGKLEFIANNMPYPKIAVAFHRGVFVELIDHPPKLRELGVIFKNISLRKGRVGQILQFKPVLAAALLEFERKKNLKQTNKGAMVR